MILTDLALLVVVGGLCWGLGWTGFLLTGNIGFHHVHHLNARIPNYNLQAAHEATPTLHRAPSLTATDALRAVRLKLWDESGSRLVTFAEARALNQ